MHVWNEAEAVITNALDELQKEVISAEWCWEHRDIDEPDVLGAAAGELFRLRERETQLLDGLAVLYRAGRVAS